MLRVIDGPCCRKDVDAVKAFSTVHLGQHLVHDAIRHARAIVSSAHRLHE